MTFGQQQGQLMLVSLNAILLLTQLAQGQQDSVSMIQFAVHGATVVNVPEAEHHAEVHPTAERDSAELQVGQTAEVQLVYGKHKGVWVPCKIESNRTSRGYNVFLPFAPAGRQTQQVPRGVLRKIKVGDYQKAVNALKDHTGYAKILAEEVEKEVAKRQSAQAAGSAKRTLKPSARKQPPTQLAQSSPSEHRRIAAERHLQEPAVATAHGKPRRAVAASKTYLKPKRLRNETIKEDDLLDEAKMHYDGDQTRAVKHAKSMRAKWSSARLRVTRQAQASAELKDAAGSGLASAAAKIHLEDASIKRELSQEQDMKSRIDEDRYSWERQKSTWKKLQQMSNSQLEQRAMFAALTSIREDGQAAGMNLVRGSGSWNTTRKALVILIRSTSRKAVFAHSVSPSDTLWQLGRAAIAHWQMSCPVKAVQLLWKGVPLKTWETMEETGLNDEDLVDVKDDMSATLEAQPEELAEVFAAEPHGCSKALPLELQSLKTHYSAHKEFKDVAARSWTQASAKARKVVSELKDTEILGFVRGSHKGEPGWYSGNIEGVPRLFVPSLRMQGDAYRFHPYRAGAARTVTCWPSPLALAATWDESLVEQVAKAMGQELNRKGVNVFLGPSVNVQRLAHSGRTFQSLSGEDPYLGARLVRPFVQGVQSNGVIACAKHFAFNDQTKSMNKVNYRPAESVARELYYPPFQAAVEAGIGAILCADTLVNGTSSCQNAQLLKHDLKKTMGFRGFVLSDPLSMKPQNRSTAFGLDVDMPGVSASSRGHARQNSQHTADAAQRVLTSVYRVGLDKLHTWTPQQGLTVQDSNVRTYQNEILASKAAAESVVLLKNDGTLPIRSGAVSTIAIFGNAADALPKDALWEADYYSGGGTGHIPASTTVASTPSQQIARRAKAAGITVVPYSGSRLDLVKAKALLADVVVIVSASTASEDEDRPNLGLGPEEDAIISASSRLRPTVVLLQTPGAMLTPWRNQVAAMASLFLGGEGTGSAWASLLFGDVTPAGKLPVMFPATDKDVIQREQQDVVKFPEGLQTSYRSPVLKAAFPFGHGLSFTNFSYSQPAVMKDSCPARLCLSLSISNSGANPGSEVAQAYVSFPKLRRVKAPVRVLRGFEKTSVLQPGKEEVVTFALTDRDLSTYDAGWALQDVVKISIGSSSTDIRHELRIRLAETHAEILG